MINKVKYTNELIYIAEMYVVEGTCVKARLKIAEDVSKEEVWASVKIYQNVGIQVGQKIDMYCDEKFSEDFKHYIKTHASDSVKKAYEEGYIELIVNWN